MRKFFNTKKHRRNNFNSRFFDSNNINQRSPIATIVQNPDFPINSNEIVQVQGPSLFDPAFSSPDYDNSLSFQLTPEQKNLRLPSKKYKSIKFADRRNLENNFGRYGQISVSNNENTTLVHGQDSDGKNTQIIINLTHQPKAYLYGSKLHENENKGNGHKGNYMYSRPNPIGPPSPRPTQPLPPVVTVSPPAPVGPPSPPVVTISPPAPVGPPSPPVRPTPAGAPSPPLQPGPPAPPGSLFRNDVIRSRDRFDRYGQRINSPRGNTNYFQTPQYYQDSNTIINPQSAPVNTILPLAQPRSLYALNTPNNPNEGPLNNYQNVNNLQPISSSRFSFSPSSFNQYGNNNPPSSESFNVAPNYAPPPQSAPAGYARPVAIAPSNTPTYFLPAGPPIQAPPSPPVGPQSTYNSPPPLANAAPSSSYASPSQQLDPVQPPAPPPPPVINNYGAPQAAPPPKPSYNAPAQNPPSPGYGVPLADVVAKPPPKPQYDAPQEDPPQAPPTTIQFHPAQISLSVIPHPITIQQPNTEFRQPSKPSYNAQQQPSFEQNEVMQLAPTRFEVVQDPQNANAVHYHVHLDDAEDMRFLNEMFAEGAENDEVVMGHGYGAPPLLSPTNNYAAPQAAPPPPQPHYGAPMQLTPPSQPLMAPRPPQMQRRPMYGRPRPPNEQRNPLPDFGGLSTIKLNSQKQSLLVGDNSKLKELLGLKCFIWCKFDKLEFATRRNDPGPSSPINQALSPRAQMARRSRARSNRRRG